MGHGGAVGGGLRPVRAQCLSTEVQGAHAGHERLCRRLARRRLASARLLSEICRRAQRVDAREALSHELYRIHPQGVPAQHDQGNLLSCARGPHARGDSEERGHDPERSPLGYAAAASDLSADPSDPPLLRILQRRDRPLSPARRLSSGHAVGARTLGAAARGCADLGEPVSAVHTWLWRGHELRLQENRRRISELHPRERAGQIGLRPEDRPAGRLLWRNDVGLPDRQHRDQGIRLPEG